ncbi:MAG: helix-turn-helix domain-containing protein [Actinobacteria bacterium]|nr:helix-turn-helix domain-containing protein [Actinomycetota bacterium]
MIKGKKEKLYTISQLSEFAGISEQELIRMILLKKIHSVRLGKSIRITEEGVERFLENLSGKAISEYDFSVPVLYTAEQVSRILQLSVDNIWLLLKSGKLKGFKIREGKSSWRIPAKNLDDFIASRIKEDAVK